MRQLYQFIKKAAILGCIILTSNFSFAQRVTIGYGTPLVTGIANGVDLVNAGDSRMFIAQQNGLIRAWDGVSTTTTTFMDLSSLGLFPNPLGGEQGLLSIAFHPDFANNRYFFIWYTGSTGAVTLARYRANVGLATGDAASGVILLSVPKPGNPYYTNHNGGKLNFGPDGMLYIGLGDGGSGGDPDNNAQDPTSLRGKMLRLNVSDFSIPSPYYTIPVDNPFASTGDGIRDEIFALGLRNPWRWSFDRANGNMWIADVGQDAYEEVNYRTAATASGINYGWRCREGKHAYNTTGCGTTTFAEPIFEYSHALGQSITGGYVYRGPDNSNAALLGTYICTDFLSGNVWMIQPNGDSILQTVSTVTNIASYGESSNGTLYALRRAGSGGVYKITVLTVLPTLISNFGGQHFSTYNTLKWTTTAETNLDKFIVEYSANGTDFTSVGEVNAVGAASGSNYTFQHSITMSRTGYYRLKIISTGGGSSYSSLLRLGNSSDAAITITPTYITNHSVNIAWDVPVTRLQLMSADGKLLYERNLQSSSGSMLVNLPYMPPGIYIIQVQGDKNVKRERVFIQ